MPLLFVDQHLGSPPAGVVVAGHARAIGARGEHRQHVTGRHAQGTLATQPIPALAHRTHDVIDRRLGRCVKRQGHDGMKGFVHGWARQIVHGSVDDAKVFLLSGFHVLYGAQAHPCIAHQGASGLDHDLSLPKASRIEHRPECFPKEVGVWRRFIFVLNPQASAKIQVMDGHAVGLDLFDQIEHPVQRIDIGLGGGDLGANVAIDAFDAKALQHFCV